MPFMPRQADHRRQGIRGAFDEGPGRDVAEVVGGQISKQGEPHVGR